MEDLDKVILNFDKSAIWIINITLAFIMFGIALDLRWSTFQNIFRKPKSLLIGLMAQWIGLPIITLALIYFFQPHPSLALGMILVSACPGGNVSNFFSALSKANVELSIVMTCVSSLISIFMTPLVLNYAGNYFESTRSIMQEVSIDWLEVVYAISLIIVLPLIVGKLFMKYYSEWGERIKKPIRLLSMAIFVIIVIMALLNNFEYFLDNIHYVFLLVLIHNLSAILIGFAFSKMARLSLPDVKSLSVEVGIQNSGLGLLLIFSFFSGLGGMAIIAAWWGIWHIISGFCLSFIFSRIDQYDV